jgi:glutamate-5-semialdehyde dehydrogenase
MMTTETSAIRTELRDVMFEIGAKARAAARRLATASTEEKDRALILTAEAVRRRAGEILEANRADLDSARGSVNEALLDRLALDPDRVEGIAGAIEAVAGLDDPVGVTIRSWSRPNGLQIEKVRVPLGVIAVIYESRPNVTADAASLGLKAGNAVILRGGSEAVHSNRAIHECVQEGLRNAGLPEDSVQLVPTTDREAVGILLAEMQDFVDVVVPRGGRSLIERVRADARVPVFSHLDGICHVYVDASANPEIAVDVTVNAKMRRVGICGAAETLLVDRAVLRSHLPAILDALIARGCAVRGDPDVVALDERATPATEEDWSTEYLAPIISVRVVDGVGEAVDHIERYGSRHTESIIAEDQAAVETFFRGIDSAILLSNASTQFADGGEFGMGAEIGIGTSKLHARGPVGVEELTSYKYVVRGSGQVRP